MKGIASRVSTAARRRRMRSGTKRIDREDRATEWCGSRSLIVSCVLRVSTLSLDHDPPVGARLLEETG